MIRGLEITDKGRDFLERHSGTRNGSYSDVSMDEELSLLKAIDSSEELVSSAETPLSIYNLPPIALYAIIRLVNKDYVVRTEEQTFRDWEKRE